MRLRVELSLTLAIVVLLLFPVGAYAATVSDISDHLICQCGCTLTLNNCTHGECGSREAMTALVKQKLDQGQSEEQIVQFFVAQYGEQVLAAPPKEGFNLTVWVLPFAALFLGGWVVYIALKRWLRRGREAEALVETEEGGNYVHQLEEELAEFSYRSFR